MELKRGEGTQLTWTVCKFKGGLAKKEGVMFFVGGVDTPNAHYGILKMHQVLIKLRFWIWQYGFLYAMIMQSSEYIW